MIEQFKIWKKEKNVNNFIYFRFQVTKQNMPSNLKKINPDIAIERRNCTFDSNEFAIWYFGGKEQLEEKRFIGK